MQRLDQYQCRCKVTGSVEEIERNAVQDIGNDHLNSAHEEIGDRAECSETQPIATRKYSPEPDRLHLSEQYDCNHKNGPDIQVIDPPDSKPIDQALDKNKDIEWDQGSSAHHTRIYDQQHRDQFDIRQERKRDLHH